MASGNPTYVGLFRMYTEQATQLATLKEAYTILATSIPRIFNDTTIPNPLQIQVPSTPASASAFPRNSFLPKKLSLKKEDYPNVKYWHRTSGSDDSGLTTVSNDTNVKLAFLEHENGTAFSSDKVADVRHHLRAVFSSLLDNNIAPLTWSQASSVALNWFRAEMTMYCPDLGLCANNWKVDTLATECYPDWTRHRRDELEA
ncbi:hypothetical protein C8R45DRAFT_1095341 [Mycena sanguinolenta]|nr:hypothetical protein C8R45DRAFT_1095341 [Mycena sanguinolenta]